MKGDLSVAFGSQEAFAAATDVADDCFVRVEMAESRSAVVQVAG